MKLFEIKPNQYINLEQIVKIDVDAAGVWRIMLTGDISIPRAPKEKIDAIFAMKESVC